MGITHIVDTKRKTHHFMLALHELVDFSLLGLTVTDMHRIFSKSHIEIVYIGMKSYVISTNKLINIK